MFRWMWKTARKTQGLCYVSNQSETKRRIKEDLSYKWKNIFKQLQDNLLSQSWTLPGNRRQILLANVLPEEEGGCLDFQEKRGTAWATLYWAKKKKKPQHFSIYLRGRNEERSAIIWQSYQTVLVWSIQQQLCHGLPSKDYNHWDVTE